MEKEALDFDELVELLTDEVMDKIEKEFIRLHIEYRKQSSKKEEVVEFINSLPNELREFALELLELNISYFMVLRPGTKGCKEVAKYGFTRSQKETLFWLSKLISD